MSALRRASHRSGTAVAAGFERSRFSATGTGIGRALPVTAAGGPTGFAVDLERVLAGVPRRALPVEPYRPGLHARRTRERWPRTPLRLPSSTRPRVRDKGSRR